MHYVLIDIENGGWTTLGLDGFDFSGGFEGADGPTLDRAKHQAHQAVKAANGDAVIVTKFVYTNRAHALYRRLLNEHEQGPKDSAAKLLADAGVATEE